MIPSNIKVALVHDYIKEFGGAERVLSALHEIWPKAPIYTSIFDPGNWRGNQNKYKDWNIKNSFLQYIPFSSKLINSLRFLSPFAFLSFNLKPYDLVIVSAAGSYSPNLIRTGADSIHLTYFHTKPKYLAKKGIGDYFLGKIDFLSAHMPDLILCNSTYTAGQVEKFYHRKAQIIFPPVELVDKTENLKPVDFYKRSYFLAGGRLTPEKNLDIVVETFGKLNLPLKIFGPGFKNYEETLKKLAGPTVEFIGEVGDRRLIELYAHALALIYPSFEEGFGLMPVEAMALGTPVIALRQGGVMEAVIEGKTGVFFKSLTDESLSSAVKRFNTMVSENQFKPAEIKKHARQFSKKRFKKEIENLVFRHLRRRGRLVNKIQF